MRDKALYILLLLISFCNAQAPTLGNFTSNTTVIESNSLTLTKPAGGVVGDAYIIIVGNDDVNSTAEFDAWAGWTKVGEAGTTVAEAHVAAFWRKVTGTEGASEVINANSTNDIWGSYVVVKNIDTNAVNIIDAVGAFNDNSSSATHTITSTTTTQTNTLAFSLIGFDGADAVSFSLTGSNWFKQDEEVAGSGATGASGAWAIKTMTSIGSTLNTLWTLGTADGAAGFQFAIKGVPNDRRIFNINK